MKVVIAYRNISVAHGLVLLLQKYGDFDNVVEVSEIEQLIPKVHSLRPDLVLIDPELPAMNLIETVKHVRSVVPEAAVTVLVSRNDRSLLDSAIQADVTSFISVDTEPEQFVLLLRLSADGHVFVSSSLVQGLSDVTSDSQISSKLVKSSSTKHSLSHRELQVLNLVAEGLTNGEIAEKLFITENTVKVHMRHILEKLELRNRQQATAFAIQSGLLDAAAELNKKEGMEFRL